MTHNKVKSLKGLESNKMLETLLAAENNLKETSEIDILGVILETTTNLLDSFRTFPSSWYWISVRIR